MQSLSLKPIASGDEPLDPVAEAARLESLLGARQVELKTLQAELLEFKNALRANRRSPFG